MAEKKGKKKWYEVLARKPFTDQVIGETPAYEDKALIGRIIGSNLGNLTRDPKLKKILGSIRNLIRKEFSEYVGKDGYDKLVSDLIGKKIQREIREKINKIYP